MRMLYAAHIVAGTLGLLSGYAALVVSKGASTHRRVGIVFVVTMVAMCIFGLSISLLRNVAPAINIPAGIITAYLAVTALTTVRESFLDARSTQVGLMLAALSVGVLNAVYAGQAFANGGTRDGMPAFPFVMFGTIGMLGAIGDVRVLRRGALTGARRIARHLWRMCIALFIAALSASFQFARGVPKEFRVPIMIIPMGVALFSMFYWLWRVRFRRSLRGLVVARVAPTA